MNHFEFKSFMLRIKRALDHLTAPKTGLGHEGEFQALLGNLIVIPVSSEHPARKGALLMFASEQWSVENINWDHVKYQNELGITVIQILAKEDETLEDIILRAKVLVFKFMHPKHYHPKDMSWKNVPWTSGGIYKPAKSVVVAEFDKKKR